MKKRNLILIFGMIFLFGVMFQLSADMTYWSDVNLDYTAQTVNHHLYIVFDDTSVDLVGNEVPIPVTIAYQVQALPYNLTYGYVDYCNLTIKHFKNDYQKGEFVNGSTETYSVLFTSGGYQLGYLKYDMMNRDTLVADLKCHYTDVNSLYQDNVLVGMLSSYVGAYKCEECEDYSLEELSNRIERDEENLNKEFGIYYTIYNLVHLNYRIILYLFFVGRILLVLLGVFLSLAGMYYVYKFLREVKDEI